jgi:hypothetical protein
MIRFERGEIVADKCGRTFAVKSQTGPLVWAAPTDGCACAMAASPFNARDLQSISAPPQFPQEAREEKPVQTCSRITERDWELAARGNPGAAMRIEAALGREEVLNAR